MSDMINCAGCGTTIHKSAERCPQCGAIQNKKVSILLGLGILFFPIIFAWFTFKTGYSKKVKLFAIIWLSLTVLAILSPRKDTKKNENSLVVKKTAENTQDSGKEKPPISLNEWFNLGKFSYNLKQVVTKQYKQNVGLIIITYDIKNEGNETHTILNNNIQIHDLKNRKFDESIDIKSKLSLQGVETCTLTQLQPAIEKECSTAFEVPLESIKPNFKIVFEQHGYGDNKVEITYTPTNPN